MSELIYSKFAVREPILRDELKDILNIQNEHSFSQYISMLLKFGLIKLFQNGIYYIPEKTQRFSMLKPSIIDIVKKKYCSKFNGFRTGAALLNQYKFTSQVSRDFEIISSEVSENSRNVKLFNGKATISSSKLPINKYNYYYVVYAEILKHIKYSDYKEEYNLELLRDLFDDLNLNKRKMKNVLKYYKGNRLLYMHILFNKVINNETT